MNDTNQSLPALADRLERAVSHLNEVEDVNRAGDGFHYRKGMELVEDVIAALSQHAERGGWVSVEERLPEVGKWVLIWHKDQRRGQMEEAELIDMYPDCASEDSPNRFAFRGRTGFVGATHWRELPLPSHSTE